MSESGTAAPPRARASRRGTNRRRTALVFTAPRRVEVVEEPLAAPAAGEVLVETEVSAISPGTELLVWRGEAPALAADATIPSLAGGLGFPLRYGYSAVGRVAAVGPGAGGAGDRLPREGDRVFAFHPHTSAFVAAADDVLPVPAGVCAEAAALLPTVETAVTLALDGAPAVGERVAVLGQGAVGLATTALLARFPLAALVTLDRWPLRRRLSLAAGAGESLDPAAPDTAQRLAALLGAADGGADADLVYELTGRPEALDDALAAAGFAARVVVGSWYGRRRAALDLGGRFHRSRVRLLASQVSTLDPARGGRWSRERRLEAAWHFLAALDPLRWVTDRVPFARAADAYRRLDEAPAETVQALLLHDGLDGGG